MPIIDLHSHPYDAGTSVKLDLFESYIKEWLPTMIMGNHDVWIFDYFAGPGRDLNGVLGSPLRILRQINEQVQNILIKKIHINVCFNEFDKDKYNQLQLECENYVNSIVTLQQLTKMELLNICYRNMDFAVLFNKTIPTLKTNYSLVFLDQNGIKFIATEYLLKLEELPNTDFLYFIASSYFIRFGNTINFQNCIKIDLKQAKKNPYKYIHVSILEQLRKMLPVETKLHLLPFSIKKENNIFGIIFGSKHILALDKFLQTAWKKNSINGAANFDIDDDEGKKQLCLFEERKLTKIESFQNKLENCILSGKIDSNIDAYLYTINEGHIGTHALQKIKELKRAGLIAYDAKSPGVTYDMAYRKRRIINYFVLTNEDYKD